MTTTTATRTSITDPLRIAEIQVRPELGMIGVTFCPGKRGDSVRGRAWDRDLAADLDVIQAWRAKAVLTLIEPHEMVYLGVSDLGERIVERGIAWYPLPIVDVSTPAAAFERGWSEYGPAACGLLQAGGNVLVHCRGGLGRAGMVAAFLAIELGNSAKEAIRRVRVQRHGAIETREQEDYVEHYVPRFGLQGRGPFDQSLQ